MATTSVKKRIFFLVFCLASVCQGMYSTYFVSILTTIERVYQIQSKTAGAIMSATEIGQISGSLLIAYYGGKGNKPKWIASCMMLTAIAALISTTPHFLLYTSNSRQQTNVAAIDQPSVLKMPYFTSDLKNYPGSSSPSSSISHSVTSSLQSTREYLVPAQDQLCYLNYDTNNSMDQNSTKLVNNNYDNSQSPTLAFNNQGSGNRTPLVRKQVSVTAILVIFFSCLLLIGFGSTAITTLGIPYIDDIVSKEESPLYLGLTIGLKIFGPALGFLLGSFCIQQHVDLFNLSQIWQPSNEEYDIMNKDEAQLLSSENVTQNPHINQFSSKSFNSYDEYDGVGAWWLGLIIISLPLLILALPMYYFSYVTLGNDEEDSASNDLHDITYQAAEDHDIGGSHDFQPHVIAIGGGIRGTNDLDVTSNRTYYSDVDASPSDALQATKSSSTIRFDYNNYVKNVTLNQPLMTKGTIFRDQKASSTTSSSSSNQNHDEGENEREEEWKRGCLVVNHFGSLESTSFTNDEAKSLHSNFSPTQTSFKQRRSHKNKNTATTNATNTATSMNLSGSLSRLIKNRLLLLRMLSGTLHILPIAGFYTFLPKYLIEQFRIAPSSASAISGLAGILFVGLGAFLGGVIIRVLNINSKLMTKWIAASALLYTIGMLILMNLGCPQSQTVYYESESYTSTDCLTNCKCSNEIYSPVCANGTTYMSPCLAGCRNYTISDDKIIFDECGCSRSIINPNQPHVSESTTLNLMTASDESKSFDKRYYTNLKQEGNINQHKQEPQLNLNVATQGHCLLNCDNLKWYIIIFSLFTLIHASCEVGSMMFNLRCVKSNDRTSALGLITFTSSLLGTIPCSVIYGTIIDLTCIHWDTVGGGSYTTNKITNNNPALPTVEATTKGSCRAYKNESFRYYLHGVTALVMFFAFIIDFIISRRAQEVNFYEEDDEHDHVDCDSDEHDDQSEQEQYSESNLRKQKDMVTVGLDSLKKTTECI